MICGVEINKDVWYIYVKKKNWVESDCKKYDICIYVME